MGMLVLLSLERLDLSASGEDSARPPCVTTMEDFAVLSNPAAIESFFHLLKLNWKKRPRPVGANGQLSVE